MAKVWEPSHFTVVLLTPLRAIFLILEKAGVIFAPTSLDNWLLCENVHVYLLNRSASCFPVYY